MPGARGRISKVIRTPPNGLRANSLAMLPFRRSQEIYDLIADRPQP